jgi:hypothetical protein
MNEKRREMRAFIGGGLQQLLPAEERAISIIVQTKGVRAAKIFRQAAGAAGKLLIEPFRRKWR